MDEKKKEGFEETVIDEDASKEEVENCEEVECEEKSDSKDAVDDKLSNDDNEKQEENTEETKDESQTLRDTIARLQADFQNYRNRNEKEKASIYSYANEGLIKKLLPVLDNLERAIATEKEHDAFFEGVQMIYKDLMKTLESEGLESFDPTGERFDPNFHHAVFMEESETVESEHVIETFQIGYKIKDRVIRPAMVKVAK